MSVDVSISHQTMTSRINYNAPLKSVRTVRAAKIDPYDSSKLSADGSVCNGEAEKADFMSTAGVAFVWENAPGHSKVEQEKVAPVELKPPPQQALAPPPSSKASSVMEERCPPPAGTPAVDMCKSIPVDHQLSSSAGISAQKMKANLLPNRQLPPKPSQRGTASVALHQQFGDQLPPNSRKTQSVSEHLSSHSSLLPHNGEYARQSGHMYGTRNRDTSIVGDRHDSSSLGPSLEVLTFEDRASTVADDGADNGAARENAFHRSSKDQAPHASVDQVSQSTLNRGSLHYLAEKMRQAPMQGGKNFHISGINTRARNLPNSVNAALPSRPMRTRPESYSPSEAGTHSEEDWDGDQTDAEDAFSQLNVRDQEVRCQVSIFEGEQHETSRHTDPRARDFIMERFLPAAKAMVTETLDISDRSSHESAPSPPTRGKGRMSLPGRSRFAFRDRFAEDERGQAEESDMLFNCKFPWQMGALTASGPSFEPRSVEHWPSAPFDNLTESSTALYQVEQQDAAWICSESEGSATRKGDNSRSFEDRCLPPKATHMSGPIPPKHQTIRRGDIDNHDRALSFSEESATGDCYELEYSSRSSDAGANISGVVPKDRLKETAARRDSGNGDDNDPPIRAPEIAFTGNLGTLLRTTQQQRRDLGKVFGAAIQTALASVPEHIPPASILNHHRNKPSRTAAKSLMHGTDTVAQQTHLNSGNVESNYLKHLKVDRIRHQDPEPSGQSGRSLESINDEVWESSGLESSPGSRLPASESSPVVLTTNHSNSPDDSVIEDSGATGWPLGKAYSAYARTPSADSKDASFSSFSDHSIRSPSNHGSSTPQERSSSEKFSPVSVLQPPLPKSPSESWLFKVRPPAPPSTGTKWRGTNQGVNPKKSLEYSFTDDSMDVKWETLVKSENAHVRDNLAQESPPSARGGHRSRE